MRGVESIFAHGQPSSVVGDVSRGIFPPCRTLSWMWVCISSASLQTLKVKCTRTNVHVQRLGEDGIAVH